MTHAWYGEYRMIVINPVQPEVRKGFREIMPGTDEYEQAKAALTEAYCETMAGRRHPA